VLANETHSKSVYLSGAKAQGLMTQKSNRTQPRRRAKSATKRWVSTEPRESVAVTATASATTGVATDGRTALVGDVPPHDEARRGSRRTLSSEAAPFWPQSTPRATHIGHDRRDPSLQSRDRAPFYSLRDGGRCKAADDGDDYDGDDDSTYECDMENPYSKYLDAPEPQTLMHPLNDVSPVRHRQRSFCAPDETRVLPESIDGGHHHPPHHPHHQPAGHRPLHRHTLLSRHHADDRDAISAHTVHLHARPMPGFYYFERSTYSDPTTIVLGEPRWVHIDDMMRWLGDAFPRAIQQAALVMDICAPNRLCACIVYDALSDTVRFYSMPDSRRA